MRNVQVATPWGMGVPQYGGAARLRREAREVHGGRRPARAALDVRHRDDLHSIIPVAWTESRARRDEAILPPAIAVQ